MAAQLSLLSNQYHNEPTPAQNGAGITEIVLSEFGDDQSAILLPMLAHLSNKCADRWLTWIAPKGINKAILTEYGFNLGRIRIIHLDSDHKGRNRMLWDALANGRSHTVVCTANNLSDTEVKELETAAIIGESRGLLLRNRSH